MPKILKSLLKAFTTHISAASEYVWDYSHFTVENWVVNIQYRSSNEIVFFIITIHSKTKPYSGFGRYLIYEICGSCTKNNPKTIKFSCSEIRCGYSIVKSTHANPFNFKKCIFDKVRLKLCGIQNLLYQIQQKTIELV